MLFNFLFPPFLYYIFQKAFEQQKRYTISLSYSSFNFMILSIPPMNLTKETNEQENNTCTSDLEGTTNFRRNTEYTELRFVFSNAIRPDTLWRSAYVPCWTRSRVLKIIAIVIVILLAKNLIPWNPGERSKAMQNDKKWGPCTWFIWPLTWNYTNKRVTIISVATTKRNY